MHEVDVIVLGGGTAGTQAAHTAVQEGCETVMFNDGALGGLCILRGCMPSKTLIHAGYLRHLAASHRTPGIARAELAVDFPAVMANKDEKVRRFLRYKLGAIEKEGYALVDARARFVGPDTVEARGERWRFRKGAVIATGSLPVVPAIPGIAETGYWTSDDVFALVEQPRSVIVVGTGAVGLELAQFLARMGTRVELVGRRQVLGDVGAVIAEEMGNVLQDEPNLTNHAPAEVLSARRSAGGVLLEIVKDGRKTTLEAEHLLLATGRRAAVDGLDLAAAGIESDGRRVRVGPDLRTTNPRVFVAGDATGEQMLLHVANWEAVVAARGAAEVPGEHRVERRLHLQVIFTDPPLATLGLNEAQARAAGHDVISAKARFAETGRAITMDVAHGALVLVAEASRGEILGAQILGPRADDLIHTVVALMHYRGTARDLRAMPWYHPTLSGVLLSLARELDGQVRRA